MVIALLLLIIAILLFGAAAVKGWLGGLALRLFGAGLVIGSAVFAGSHLGPDGPILLFVGVLAVLFVVGLFAKAQESMTTTRHEAARGQTARPVLPLVIEEGPADRVWSWFADDIANRFDDRAQRAARALYEAGNANGLDRFCRAEQVRITMQPSREA